METTAAKKERQDPAPSRLESLFSLAACAPKAAENPVNHCLFQSPTGCQSSQKLATGFQTSWTQTNIWETSCLGPKTWWSAVYYYRARWYLPEGGVFGERDPVGYGDGSNPYQWLLTNPANFTDVFGEKTNVSFSKEKGIISVDGFIEFYGEDGDRHSANEVARSIEAGWNKQVRLSDGRIIKIVVKIHYIYSSEGGSKRVDNWDQILLYRAGKDDMSQMNLADPVTDLPEAELREDKKPVYRRSIAGGVSVGRINLNNFEGGFLPARYPGVPAHEWGHAIGLWYHVGSRMDLWGTPDREKVERFGRESPVNLDPMRSCKVRPEDYVPSEKEVLWLIDVAERQAKENPAYVGGSYEFPPLPGGN